jgi:PIN domain nuclease of toxin-antitoxin system
VAEYVLDTHACLHALLRPQRLGRRARAILERVDAGRDVAWVPAAVAAEVVLLLERGRTPVGLPQLRAALSSTRWMFLPLELDQLDEFAALSSLVDPFDRFIVAAARSKGAKLMTADRRISESGLVDVVWD